jgi:pyruvate dehydrogenase E1 component
VTSFTQLRRDGLETERWNMLHPEATARKSYVERSLEKGVGPVIAATDYMKSIADGIRPLVPARYKVLGTDGFGRSDTRRHLRSFFEVDRHFVAIAALKALADDQLSPSKRVSEAIKKYGVDPERANPALT